MTPGDLGALAWFLRERGLCAGPLTVSRIGDGHSNLTYAVSDGQRTVVVRRPPPPPAPSGAHDVLREARLMDALRDTAVPVPTVLATARAGEVFDVPCYVMSFAQGPVITAATPAALAGPGTRREIGESLIDTLAALHAVDWRTAGLGELGRPEGFNPRHLRRMERLIADGNGRVPSSFAPVRDWLAAHVPPESGAAIVHSDFRLGNVVIAPDAPGRVAAVLDWELATVGDPLLDVGYFLASVPEPGEPLTPVQELGTAMLEDGYLRLSDELSAAHIPATGGTLGPLSWDVAEPMRTWRAALGPNPAGLEFDLTWRARTPAWTGDVTVANADGTPSSFAHLFQSGRYEGAIRVDGREVRADGWYGQRDRSRGVRTMSGGQGLHLWVQAQFPDRSVGFLTAESRGHERHLLEGAVMYEDGRLDPVTDVRHDLSFDDGLDLRGGLLEVTTRDGAVYRIAADAAARGGYMSGGGYGGQHGRPMGRGHVEHDVYPLDGSVSPRTLDSALTDRLTVFTWDGTPGRGIFEFALTRSPSYAYKPTLP